jgi:septum formation protein
MQLVLASTSRYRRELLTRLGLPFEAVAPNTDETALHGESPSALALRLAQAKAWAVAEQFPDALIIGSDQVATTRTAASADKAAQELILGKPGNHDNARRQLQLLSGNSAHFHTGLALHNTRNGQTLTELISIEVRFRTLSDAQIERYLEREQPFDCAGAAKSEGLGIALIEGILGNDPNALVGLPLIALTGMLSQFGMPVL